MNRRDLLQGASLTVLSGGLLRTHSIIGEALSTDAAGPGGGPQSRSAAPKTFILTNSIRDMDEFTAFARAASKLKPFGDVQIDIGVLADKSWYETPPPRNPWYEYANERACIEKYFPHAKVAPFIPADYVAQNRALLLAKAAVLRQLGLHAAFSGDDTHFLPEAFFGRYPHLRGPRVDHPRRSNLPAFSWCVDLAETREMIEWMAMELKRQVPEIRTLLYHCNDSGGGFCWAAQSYTGPNGPAHCENRNTGVRVRDYVEAIHRGAIKGGGDVAIRLWGPFSTEEELLIVEMAPPNTYLEKEGHDPARTRIGTLIHEAYPLRGLLNPIATLATLESANARKANTFEIGTASRHDRISESLLAAEKLIEIQKECLAAPTHGLISRFDKLRQLSVSWGGKQNADALVEAFYEMNEAFVLKETVAPRYGTASCDVSARFVTRPLLFNPDVLSHEEESYFLPYVFNISDSQARDNYNDIGGETLTGPASWEDAGLRLAFTRALHAAQILEGAKGAPSEQWLMQVALSLRMWVSEVRSINNFYFAQLLRNRNAATIAAGPRAPSTQSTWTGDPDYLEWNAIQRDELDNTNELIALLVRKGGLESMGLAPDKKHEDTFVFGPDLVASLHEKARLMQREWLDVQKYLASPNI